MVGQWFHLTPREMQHELQKEKQRRAGIEIEMVSHGFDTPYGKDICRNEFAAVCLITISRLRQYVRSHKRKCDFSVIISIF